MKEILNEFINKYIGEVRQETIICGGYDISDRFLISILSDRLSNELKKYFADFLNKPKDTSSEEYTEYYKKMVLLNKCLPKAIEETFKVPGIVPAGTEVHNGPRD